MRLYPLAFGILLVMFSISTSVLPLSTQFEPTPTQLDNFNLVEIAQWDVEDEMYGDKWDNVNWSPDGKLIGAIGGGQIYLWDVATGEVVRKIEQTHLQDFTWSPDGKYLAASPSVGSKMVVNIWEAATGKLVNTIEDNNRDVRLTAFTTKIAWSPNGKQIAAMSGALILWDLESEKNPMLLRNYAEQGTGLAWSPDGHFLATTGIDAWWEDNNPLMHPLQIWDMDTREVVQELGNGVKVVAWSPDGKWLVSRLPHPEDLAVWETSSWEMVKIFDAPDKQVAVEIAWSSDSTVFATSSTDGNIYLWNLKQNTPIQVVQGHTHTVADIDWHPSQPSLVSASDDGTIRVWGSTITEIDKSSTQP